MLYSRQDAYMWKNIFFSLDFTNRDDKSTWGNGKRPSRQDCIG
jgi:hypothetical protein